MNIKTNDTVMILQGRDRGKTGKVLRAYPAEDKVLVEKLNVVKKHLKPTRTAPHGGIQESERPVSAAKVMLVCPRCNKPTRLGHKVLDNSKSVRMCRICKEVID